MTGPLQHNGAWWDRRTDGLIVRWDDNAQEWTEWDPYEAGSVPPTEWADESVANAAGDVAEEVRKLRFLILMIVLIPLAILVILALAR